MCNLRKGEEEDLYNIVKMMLKKEGCHGRKASDERLYRKREDGGRGLENYKEVYYKIKVRVAC